MPLCDEEQPLCQLQMCGRHGRCNPQNGACICEEGWDGDQCQYPTCSGHGMYDKEFGRCNCFEGYGEEDCDKCMDHPVDVYGHEDKTMRFMCVLKDDAFYRDPSTNRPMFDGPMRFKLVEEDVVNVDLALMGVAGFGRSPKRKVILPGSELNGHVYGCDCLPAIPDSRVYSRLGEGANDMDILAYEGKLHTNAMINGHVVSNGAEGRFYTSDRTPQPRISVRKAEDVKFVNASDRFLFFREDVGEMYRKIFYKQPFTSLSRGGIGERAPANLTQLQTWADKVGNIFNLKIDAATDDVTVLYGFLSDIRHDLNFYQYFGPGFMGLIWLIIWIISGITMIALCFLWRNDPLSAFMKQLQKGETG